MGPLFVQKQFGLKKGEKNYLNLEKKKLQHICHIKKLICAGNTEITDPNAILQMQQDYYEYSYNSSKIEHSFINNVNILKLYELDKAISEKEKKDYVSSLKKLANDKSPGSDGLTSNFYKFFGSDISDLLIDSYNYTFHVKELTQAQKVAIINLIPPPKNKDLRFLKKMEACEFIEDRL